MALLLAALECYGEPYQELAVQVILARVEWALAGHADVCVCVNARGSVGSSRDRVTCAARAVVRRAVAARARARACAAAGKPAVCPACACQRSKGTSVFACAM